MKLNISYPATGCQKLIEVDDEKKLRPFYDKRMATKFQLNTLEMNGRDMLSASLVETINRDSQ